jgi:hypothetical protein
MSIDTKLKISKKLLKNKIDFCMNELFVSAPVHPHVLIIVKTYENRIEHISATLQMT